MLPTVEFFDDWYAAGPEADDCWKAYEQGRERTYQEALEGYAAKHVFDFDTTHLKRTTHALLILPAGKSGHMELMYAAYGLGHPSAILLDPDDVRWDVMYQFIPNVFQREEEVIEWLKTTPSVSQKTKKVVMNSPLLKDFWTTSPTRSQPSQD